ncbi:tRNA (N(6)-L-threonylcarbamoyladenosine(37)-C(2))-methylthiotransferase [Thermococcus sp. 101 C5]|jgi:MiaB-like tRNA modifying enzyme|uniref:tRNA (N(6)-L-threonylcarbamoyladenosine(37)-C(2))- methylthiotransferase n=1 Tax=unclassified Thermococcus TaxID=2627626 RepID=UPI0005B2E3F2|nr:MULTISPECIES: tRNA (N(6)-L-threonylcarbamoyladenosine(37)-C(2))-methylthiotransferase [unclassified Thermococcus]MDK2983967.1 threonylcarbamoyladenosine tRNA methylthiotransferase [Thermococcaceae archaeon]MPW38863.1 tRNA (N(6)-L-threonylcarbamoyladenosine(37)-C(2))-methylthiotransferase [Thermococcus sp. 101 C5]
MRVHIETYGCTRNKADAEIMEALLLKAGYEIADLDSAEYVVVNTCAVKDPTEKHMSRRIKELIDSGKKVIVTGCLPHVNPNAIDERVSAILGVKSIDRIVEAIQLAERGERLISVEGWNERAIDKLELPRVWKGGVAFVVPISEGCLNACTYCATRFARGVLKSYKPELIVKWVKEAISKGYKEIQLSSEDTGCYGFDIGTNLAKLLDEITAIEGDFRIRVGMMNPNNAIKILDELVEVYKDEKIYKFLHLPVQSGDNEILRKMGRTYTVEEFEEIVKEFRKHIKDLNLNTDIIVGFPGESEEAFQNTVELIERVRPDKINVSRFSPRPGTLAAKMKEQIVGWKVKERSRYLHRLRLAISYEINKRYVGREVEVLTHSAGEKGGIEGRTMNYKDIILPDAPIGEFVRVKVTKATSTYLMGEVVE